MKPFYLIAAFPAAIVAGCGICSGRYGSDPVHERFMMELNSLRGPAPDVPHGRAGPGPGAHRSIPDIETTRMARRAHHARPLATSRPRLARRFRPDAFLGGRPR